MIHFRYSEYKSSYTKNIKIIKKKKIVYPFLFTAPAKSAVCDFLFPCVAVVTLMGLFSCDVEGSSLETDDSCKYKFANFK